MSLNKDYLDLDQKYRDIFFVTQKNKYLNPV